MPGRDTIDKMQAFVEQRDLATFPHIPDGDDAALWSAFGVRGQPAWVLVSLDGSTEVGFGAIPEDVLTRAAGA